MTVEAASPAEVEAALKTAQRAEATANRANKAAAEALAAAGYDDDADASFVTLDQVTQLIDAAIQAYADTCCAHPEDAETPQEFYEATAAEPSDGTDLI